ncbi:hypothetical protein [Gordonia sp. CPCC 205333]|uniref:hypothetical protein n=1 Tax=Gordonia sp. CPCC 205333 TaxID=3140790 RepID=UPI003AF3BC06
MSDNLWRVKRRNGFKNPWTVQRRHWLAWRVVGHFATHAEAISDANRRARPDRRDYALAGP